MFSHFLLSKLPLSFPTFSFLIFLIFSCNIFPYCNFFMFFFSLSSSGLFILTFFMLLFINCCFFILLFIYLFHLSVPFSLTIVVTFQFPYSGQPRNDPLLNTSHFLLFWFLFSHHFICFLSFVYSPFINYSCIFSFFLSSSRLIHSQRATS